VIKYLGSKRLLLPRILACIQALPDVRCVLDLFSGTSRVGHALKAAGYDVVANDHNTFAHVLARCYVAADADHVLAPVTALLEELSALPGKPGYITETFGVRARYIHPRNGARIDAIRQRIAGLALEPDLEAVCLTSLIEAADRVDSTTGVQMAYLKAWAPRARNELALRVPAVLPGAGRALHGDALEAASLASIDVAYLDPPYNQHSYRGNYHVWETLARGDEPETYGIAHKRVDCQEFKSSYNSKVRIRGAFEQLIERLRARFLVVSFSNEGYIARDDLETILTTYGEVAVFEADHPRYVGARIGIHNPKGERVGRVSHLRNKEYLFVVSREPGVLPAVRAAMQAFPSSAEGAAAT
jgi:adenine-specific DNA-methyltransferase